MNYGSFALDYAWFFGSGPDPGQSSREPALLAKLARTAAQVKVFKPPRQLLVCPVAGRCMRPRWEMVIVALGLRGALQVPPPEAGQSGPYQRRPDYGESYQRQELEIGGRQLGHVSER